MIGYAVAIRRKDGTLFLATPAEGINKRVWRKRSEATPYANELREHRLDAIVVKVEYSEPVIVGPWRYVGRQA